MPRGHSIPKFNIGNAPRHRAMDQLRELLELDKIQFQEMKETFGELTAIHFDVDKNGRSQPKAMELAIEDLKSELPALFKKGNTEQREFFARRAFFILHNCRRKKSRHERKNRKASEEDGDDDMPDADNHSQENKKLIPRPLSSAKPGPSLTQRMAANLLSITSSSHAPKIFASPVRTPRNASSAGSVTITASRSLFRQQRSPDLPPQTPHANTSFSLSSISEPRTFYARVPPPSLARHDFSDTNKSGASQAEETSFSPPTASGNMVAGSSTSTSCGDMQGCSVALPFSRSAQIRSVYKFLDAAIPSMTQFLHRFIEFGCLGEDFLFAVSMWSPERIRTFLKSLPPGPGGRALTKMEVEILAYHFESYFQASNSKV